VRVFLAILKDSFREAVDSKVLYFLVSLSLISMVFCLGVGFKKQPYAEAVERLFSRSSWGAVRIPEGELDKPLPPLVPPKVVSIEEDGGVVEVTLEMKDPEAFHARVLINYNFDPKDLDGSFQYEDRDINTLEGESGFKRYLQTRLMLAGYIPNRVRKDGDGHYVVTCGPQGEFSASGAQSLTLFFGLSEINLVSFSARRMVLRIQSLLANNIAGQFGVLIAVVVTAWFMPNMLKKGSIDLLLARPVPRWRLLVYRYLGGLTFVALNASILIGGTWAGLTIGTGFVQWGYLLCAVTLTLLFAIVYSVSVLTSVLFRNVVLSIVFPVAFWFVCSTVNTIHLLFDNPILSAAFPVPKVVKDIFEVIYYVVPSTTDLGSLNVYFMSLGEGEESIRGTMAAMGQALEQVDYTGSILSSLAFTAVMVALAAYFFHRKDF